MSLDFAQLVKLEIKRLSKHGSGPATLPPEVEALCVVLARKVYDLQRQVDDLRPKRPAIHEPEAGCGRDWA